MKDKSTGSMLLRGTIVIVFVGIIAKFIAFIAEAVLAAYLGTTYQSDAYYMVSSVKAVVYPMLSIGIWNVFLPLYKGYIVKAEIEKADTLTNKTLSFFLTISLGVALLQVAFAPLVVSIVAPGFEGETRTLCIKLVRVSAPSYVFIIASAVYASMLQCHNKFLGSQIREIASHIPTILAVIFFYKTYGIEVMAIALVVSGLFRLLIEFPFVDWGYKYKPDFNFKSQKFSLMLKRLPSAFISAGVEQLNLLIDKAMASTLPEGTISSLNYSQKMVNVFSGFLSSAIATALYPQMIDLITRNAKEELSKLVAVIFNIYCILMFPVTIACVLFRTELVVAVFQRGAFDVNSTTLTAGVFAMYCLGMYFIACNLIISNIFYGFGNTKMPMYIGIANLGINVVLNLTFIQFWGMNGLALATSFSAFITFLIRLGAVRCYINLRSSKIVITGIKVLIASVIACGFPRVIFWIHPINNYLMLLISALIGVLIYLILVKLLKIHEISYLVRLMKREMKKNKIL